MMIVYFLGDVSSSFGRGKDKKKRKSVLYNSIPYAVPVVAGTVGSLGGTTIKGKIIRGIGSAALASGVMLGAKKLNDANESGKIRDLGSRVGLNSYKKKRK